MRLHFKSITIAACVAAGLTAITLLILVLLHAQDSPDPDDFIKEGMLVNRPDCKIPSMDPFGSDVQPYLRKAKELDCPDPIILLQGSTVFYNTEHDDFLASDCCFQEIHETKAGRESYDIKLLAKTITYSSACTPIPKTEKIDFKSEFIRVTCTFNSTPEWSPEMYYYTLPKGVENHSKATSLKSRIFWNATMNGTNKLARAPSVVVIGIPSTSRNNFIRMMPQTRKYILESRFIELKGFNKVANSSLANLLALTAGIQHETDGPFKDVCYDAIKKRDDCPHVWKEFSKRGYITGYVEDSPRYPKEIHQKLGMGFKEDPTDYFYRPFTLAYMQPGVGEGRPSCVGGVPETSMTRFYFEELVKDMQMPLFFFSWFGSAGHHDMNTLKTSDIKFRELVQTVVEQTEYWRANEPIVFFLSDEGFRHGPFPLTTLGSHEQNLPFAYVRIPEYIQTHYPLWQKNLERNAHQLTTPYDIHATFGHILQSISADSQFKFRHLNWTYSSKIRHAYSLFEEMPVSRSCKSAGIPKQLCSCHVEDQSLEK